MSFEGTWLQLGIIVLSEVNSYTESQMLYCFLIFGSWVFYRVMESSLRICQIEMGCYGEHRGLRGQGGNRRKYVMALVKMVMKPKLHTVEGQ